jgi:hypothetical protein
MVMGKTGFEMVTAPLTGTVELANVTGTGLPFEFWTETGTGLEFVT